MAAVVVIFFLPFPARGIFPKVGTIHRCCDTRAEQGAATRRLHALGKAFPGENESIPVAYDHILLMSAFVTCVV